MPTARWLPQAMAAAKAVTEKIIVSFDLSWGGTTGVAVITVSSAGYTLTGSEIKPPSHKGRVTPFVQVRRAFKYIENLLDVLSNLDNAAMAGTEIVIAYEDPTKWLFGAARSGSSRHRRRPVTRNSILGATYPIACLWVAIGQWQVGLGDDVCVSIIEVDTRQARKLFGVKDWLNLKDPVGKLLRELEDSPGYADSVKASIGVAVHYRLLEDGIDMIPVSDHVADAILFGLVEMDASG